MPKDFQNTDTITSEFAENSTNENRTLLTIQDFRSVFDNFQDVFFIIYYDENEKQQGVVITPSVYDVLGYKANEFTNLDFSKLYYDKDERNAFYELIKVEKHVKNYPLTLLHKDGSKLNVEVDSEYLTDCLPNNAAYGLRGVLRDVTKQYKENLRSEIAYLIAAKSQRRLTTIKSLAEFIHATLNEVVDVSNFYIAIHDIDNNELYMPIIIDDYIDVKGNEHRVTFENSITEYIINTKQIIIANKVKFEALVKEKKIETRGKVPEYFIGIPLKSEGRCFGVMGMQTYKVNNQYSTEDIELFQFIATQVAYVLERTLWQTELLKKEEHYRSLVENSTEIIGIINNEGVLLYISESIERITGFKVAELIGRNVTQFINQERVAKIIDDRFKDTSTSKQEILKILDKKGNRKYLEISLNKSAKNKGELIFNAKDITQRVIADKEKEYAQKRLNTLNKIKDALLSDKTISEILNDALDVITDNVFNVDRASVGLIDYAAETVEIIALKTKYNTKGGVSINEIIPFNQMLSLSTILKKETFIVENISELKNKVDSDIKNSRDGIQSYLISPIIINNEVIGTFNFGSKAVNYFKDIDKELLSEITKLVAVVIKDSILKKELAEREADLTTIFNSSTEGIVKTNAQRQFTFVNKGMCNMLGYKEEELLGMSISDITHAEDINITNQTLNKLKNKKSSYNIKKRLIHKNGGVIDCRIFGVPFYNSNKEFIHTISFIYDETEQRKAQKQVANYRNALNFSAGVFFTNINGRIVDANKSLEELSGYSKEEIIGSSANMFNSNYHSSEEWENMWQTIKAGKLWKGEIRNRKKDGSMFWVFETITPILSHSGAIEQFISIQFDITKDKLEKNNLVREVIEAQEHERERFAMEIHDGLGQVLLAAKMNLSALSEAVEGLGDESKKIFNHSIDLISEAVHEARNISHGLMSRVLHKFGLAYAVNEIINDINTTSSLKIDFKHNIADFRFDEEKEMGVYRTIQELLKNIIKHSKASKANLSILQQEGKLLIEIKDNGVGIEQGAINNPKSAGIGLRNMKSRIEYLGGTFRIDKKRKKGTSININISL